MAITRNELQITWAAANSVNVAAGGNQTSDEVTLSVATVNAQISIKAVLTGVGPAVDDTLYVWLLQTSGDPDGAAADEFDTYEVVGWFVALDMNFSSPAQITIELPVPQKGFMLFAEGITAGTTNDITVSATITEQQSV